MHQIFVPCYKNQTFQIIKQESHRLIFDLLIIIHSTIMVADGIEQILLIKYAPNSGNFAS